MFGKDKKNNERFKTVYKQGTLKTYEVLVDLETGVNYLFRQEGYSGGLTVLLGKDGKPVITPTDE